MTTWVLVAVGAMIGAPLRYAAGQLLDRVLPWGTVLVNVAGSFLLGLVTGLDLAPGAAAFVGTGLAGALTTYSAFAVRTHDSGPRVGALVVLLTVPPALAACAMGHGLA